MPGLVESRTVSAASAATINSVSGIGRIIDPDPLAGTNRSWTLWVGPAVSLLILAAVIWQLRVIDYRSLITLLPTNPVFWILFAGYYLATPISEWVIFRRLWSLPPAGFAALLRKLVSNEILLGYLGEVYFYAWARQNGQVAAAPFGAIKDVAILSALAGNVFTLVMVVLAIPLFGTLNLGMNGWTFAASAMFVLVSSMAMLLLRGRLFTLPREALSFVATIHMLRIIGAALLSAMMWHLLLPAVALGWWLLLGTLRQLLSRLPLIPNKEIVFAGLAAMLVGSDHQIVAAMTLIASLILGVHVLVGAALGIAGLANKNGQPK